MAKGGLGKGLNAFFTNVEVEKGRIDSEKLTLAECRPNPYQPRKLFDQEAIEELSYRLGAWYSSASYCKKNDKRV